MTVTVFYLHAWVITQINLRFGSRDSEEQGQVVFFLKIKL